MLIFIKKSKPAQNNPHTQNNDSGIKKQQSSDINGVKEIISMLDPLLSDAKKTADIIEKQLIEKKQIVHDLNEKLDRRISNLNLLISRAETCLEEIDQVPQLNTNHSSAKMDLSPLYKSVLSLYRQGLDKEKISSQLSIPMCEVDLVISLNKHTM
jgi:phosphopantothenoylcysteine synthetase/decarboxylase